MSGRPQHGPSEWYRATAYYYLFGPVSGGALRGCARAAIGRDSIVRILRGWSSFNSNMQVLLFIDWHSHAHMQIYPMEQQSVFRSAESRVSYFHVRQLATGSEAERPSVRWSRAAWGTLQAIEREARALLAIILFI